MTLASKSSPGTSTHQFKYIKRGWLYRPISNILTRIPLIGEYFTFSVMSVLEKAGHPKP